MIRSLVVPLLAALTIPAFAYAHGEPSHDRPTAEQALKALQQGNARFVKGKPIHPDGSLARVKETAVGQKPFAVVLGCADSRTPPELIFDQGFGDLFVVRVAGNVAEPATVGSVEYAAEHLGTPLVVVLGHHKCGAVKATSEAHGEVEGNIGAIVKEIAPAVEAARKSPRKEGLVDDAVHVNTTMVAAQLTGESPVLKKLVAEGKVKIVTAVYDLESGTIEW